MELSKDQDWASLTPASSPVPCTVIALIHTCWGEMTWLIMTTNDSPFSSGDGAGRDLWKLCPFSAPGSLWPRHQKLPEKKFPLELPRHGFLKTNEEHCEPKRIKETRHERAGQTAQWSLSCLWWGQSHTQGWQPSLFIFWGWSEKSALSWPYYLYLSWLTEMFWQKSKEQPLSRPTWVQGSPHCSVLLTHHPHEPGLCTSRASAKVWLAWLV